MSKKNLVISSAVVITLFLLALPYLRRTSTVNYESPVYPGHNIILISIETLRTDHIGCYGYGRNTTPFIDSVAGEGILFENAFTVRGVTEPSLTSLLTALYPVSTNVRDNGEVLEKGIPTLSSILKDEGYTTAAYLSTACQLTGYSFDETACTRYTDKKVLSNVIKFLKRNRGRKFLLFMHFFAPHRPYKPPKKHDVFRNKGYERNISLGNITKNRINVSAAELDDIVSLYDGDILYVDSSVRRVFDVLDDLGLLDNSVILIFADHGEDLYQHDYYFFHQCSIYDSSLHIPLIIRFPDKRFSGKRVKAIVENIDITPTILDLLNVSKLPAFEGKSMLPLLAPNPPVEEFTVALSELNSITSIRTPRWRYVYNPENLKPECRPKGNHYQIDIEELYDHSTDPLEQSNVVDKFPEVASRLREDLLHMYPTPNESSKPVKVDEETLRQLKRIGYVV